MAKKVSYKKIEDVKPARTEVTVANVRKFVEANNEKKTKVEVEVEVVKESDVEVVKAETIFDKYRTHIQSSKDGYVRNLTYPEAMEMLRHIEKKTNRKLGLNLSCSSCTIDLVKMFSRLENK